MKKLICLSLLLHCVASRAQPGNSVGHAINNVNAIEQEGYRLYNSEVTSWYGTDLFIERCKDKSAIGGYFSYADDQGSKCVFVNRDVEPKVLGTVSFGKPFNVNAGQVDMSGRPLTASEHELYKLRKKHRK